MKQQIDYTILMIAIVILIAVVIASCGRKSYYYNAYAPGYDEYFVIKSYSPMPLDTIVHFDDNAVITNQRTGYTCKILSPYIK